MILDFLTLKEMLSTDCLTCIWINKKRGVRYGYNNKATV